MALLTPTRLRRSSLNLSPRALSPLGVVEALVTPHGLDRYLELVNPMLTVRELRAEITDVHRSTDDSTTITLRPTRQWKGFEAGQFVSVHVTIDGRRHTRCYSPACSQYRRDGHIELTVKAHPEGLVSQWLHANARPGLVVGLSQADGVFTLPSPRPRELVLISGGSGITPVMSMLRTLVDEEHTGKVVFLHYAFTDQHVAYLDELRTLVADRPNIKLVLAYTEQQLGGDLHGLFHPSHLRDVAPWYADAETFLCGPPGLMKAIRAHYSGAGIERQLHVEEFVTAPLAAPDAEATGELAFATTSATAANDGRSILEQAEDAGLTPQHGCRMGICFTCTAVKTSGTTRDLRTGEVNADSDCEIQICVSAPVGDVTVEL